MKWLVLVSHHNISTSMRIEKLDAYLVEAETDKGAVETFRQHTTIDPSAVRAALPLSEWTDAARRD